MSEMNIRSLWAVCATIAVIKNRPTPVQAHSLICTGTCGSIKIKTATIFKTAG